jgi:hypothetical protein
MNTVMRTMGGAIGGQIAAAVITGSVLRGLPSDAVFTRASAFCAIAMLAHSRPACSSRAVSRARPASRPGAAAVAE